MPIIRQLTLLILTLFLACTAHASDRVVLQLPWDHQFQFAGYYAADLMGYYADAGLTVEIRPAITRNKDFLEPPAEVLAGRADFGIGSGDIILANEKSNRLRVIASIFQSSATRFYVKKSPPITSLAALVEHGTVARRLNSFVDIELQAMLRSEGIDPARVKSFKAIPGVSHFVDGRIDLIAGYALTFPYEIQQHGVATTEINPQNYGVNFYGDSLFTSKELISENPQLVENFLQASLQGWSYALEHPEQLVEYIAAGLPRTHPVDDSYRFNQFQASHINQHTNYPIVQPGHINPHRWGKMHQALREAGLVDSRYDPAQLIWTPALEKARTTEQTQRLISYGLAISLSVVLLLTSFVLLLRKLVRKQTDSLQQAHLQALRRQAEFAAVFQSITDAMVLVDSERRIIRVNKAFTDIFGYQLEEVKNKPTQLLYADPTTYHQQGQERYNAGAQISSPVYEMDYRRKDGSLFTGETLGVKVETEEGSQVGFLGVIRDITERLESERQIRTLSKFPDENPGPVLRADPDGKLLYANPASAPLLQEWRIKVGEQLSAEFRTQLDQARQKESSYALPWDCGERTFSLVLTPIPEENYINIYGQDITESKQLEEQLRQSEKMQAIGQLAGGVAHDFNNQLGVILGSAELLGKTLDDERQQRYLGSIKTAGLRAADLTQKLLAFSRKGKYLSQPLEIHKIIAEVVTLLEHSIDKRIKIGQQLNASQNTVIGDSALLQNALLNLALNARDAMPDGGEIIFATDLIYLGADECSKFGKQLTAGEYLLVSVSDSGCGMDADTQRHMFEPFYTTKSEGRGTGLGLASVYGTVKNHSGTIEVVSEPGRGTRIKIFLPLVAAEQAMKTAPRADQIIAGDGHILVVDDEQPFRDMIGEMLVELGYRVTICSDGKEAINLYRDHWQQYDLVILDMIMPELSGRDTFLAMHQFNPEIRVLLSTGFSSEENIQELIELGLSSFLAKPFSQQELSEKVAAALGRSSP